MTMTAHEGLIELMVIAASADSAISTGELARIEALVGRLPAFEGFDRGRIADVANGCADKLNSEDGLDRLVGAALGAIPVKLHDTAYALAVEIIAQDLHTSQEELRFLELMRDTMALDRLTTAAIEVAARARHRRMP